MTSRVFEKLGAAFVMLFALSVCHAQSLVGLPQYGLLLTGTPDSPELVNNSGRGLLAFVVYQKDTEGHWGTSTTHLDSQIRLGETPSLKAITPGFKTANSTSPHVFVEARIDAVLFDNGEFVGPDVGNSFAWLSAYLDAERQLGQQIVGKHLSWNEVQAIDTQARSFHGAPQEHLISRARMTVAQDVLHGLRNQGEGEAMKRAGQAASLPVVWRIK